MKRLEKIAGQMMQFPPIGGPKKVASPSSPTDVAGFAMIAAHLVASTLGVADAGTPVWIVDAGYCLFGFGLSGLGS